jgi:hypothetical protein
VMVMYKLCLMWYYSKGTNMCYFYMKNPSVGTDLTDPNVKLVTTYLIARHKVETTHTSDGTFPEVVKKGKKER